MLHILKAMRDDRSYSYEPIVFYKEEDHDNIIFEFYNRTKSQEYVSHKVACAVLQKTRKMIQSLRTKKDGLKSKLIGNRVFFKKQDLIDYLEKTK